MASPGRVFDRTSITRSDFLRSKQSTRKVFRAQQTLISFEVFVSREIARKILLLTRQSCGLFARPRARSWPRRIFPPLDTHFVKWSRCFFHCAVVIKVQCTSIRDCTVTTAPFKRG